MESMKNNFKGYDKVGNPSQPNNHRRRIIFAGASALFLTLIIAAVIGAVIHESVTESSESEENHPSLSSNSDASLKTVCAVTQHPDSCVTSISSFNSPAPNNPVHFFNLSLQYNLLDLKNISSYPQTLIPRSNDKGTESALNDCVSLFLDSLSQVNQTVELMSVGPGEKVFTETKISDMNTWISASMTNLDTCLDGLKEMKSTVVDQVSARVQQSEEGLSNTLAILSNLQKLQGLGANSYDGNQQSNDHHIQRSHLRSISDSRACRNPWRDLNQIITINSKATSCYESSPFSLLSVVTSLTTI